MTHRQYISKVLVWLIAFFIQLNSSVSAQSDVNSENIITLVTVEEIRVKGYTVFSDRVSARKTKL